MQAALSEAGLKFDETAVSLIVFGSMARREWTSGSDVDWTLLVDAPAIPRHFEQTAEISTALASRDFVKPGETGTFGSLASGYDLVHHVGGQDDTNLNLTRRLLLLLESRAVNGELVRSRVLQSVLNRYIVCGRGVRENHELKFRVPRFLLNDAVRYWRTMCVDYGAKKWEQRDKYWALRNAKLRVSRKLIFAKGLLFCFDCELFAKGEPWQSLMPVEGADRDLLDFRLQAGAERLAELTPLDALSRVLLAFDQRGLADHIFGRYNSFLEFIDDSENRNRLKTMTFDVAATDAVFARVRQIGHEFGEGLEELFFRGPKHLVDLTQKYGVF
jgi:predicted nucleotidyltransferase